MRQDTAATKARIVSIAEKLFAEKGVENVTLAEINQKSGQKNRSALQYHFGGKKELIDAIMNKHLLQINDDRNRILDRMDEEQNLTIRAVAEAIVLPLTNRLNAEGGICYIRITAQLFANKDFPYLRTEDLTSHFASERMWRFASKAGVGFSEALQFTRIILILSMLFQGLSNYVQITASGKEPPEGVDNELFVLDLIDSIEALLEKTPSTVTKAKLNRQ